jgi:FMN phosphatase YigB (HAD superfamily)
MALTLEQYIAYLDNQQTPWPSPPEIERPRARPHLVRLTGVRAVTWNLYGTLLAIAGGELFVEHPEAFIMEVALDKTIQEFKMWAAMSRKPGQPTDYLRQVYADLVAQQCTLPGDTEKFPEVIVDRLWEAFIKRLLQKDYKVNAGLYGSLNEFSRKVAYFFHASLQGITAYPGAADALRLVKEQGLHQAIAGDGQCFSLIQLQRCLSVQDPTVKLDQWVDSDACALSYEVRSRLPSDKVLRHALATFAEHDVSPPEVLHVGSRVAQDVVPARRLGMKTALFAGDKGSLQATPEQLKEPVSRPDVLLTELPQIGDVIPCLS